jgi:hypothetical protein
MAAPRIDSRLVTIGIAAIPAELISFSLFSLFPIDVGYPPGTNPLWYISLIGVWLHAPAFFVVDKLPQSLVLPVTLLLGYLTIIVLAVAVLFLLRVFRKIISSE